jgi:hypothetical protein
VGISLRQRRTLWETTVNTFHDPDILAQALLAERPPLGPLSRTEQPH